MQYQEPEDHQDLLDLQGFQVLLGLQVLLEDQAFEDPLDQRGTWVLQERLVFRALLVHQVLQGQVPLLCKSGVMFSTSTIKKRTLPLRSWLVLPVQLVLLVLQVSREKEDFQEHQVCQDRMARKVSQAGLAFLGPREIQGKGYPSMSFLWQGTPGGTGEQGFPGAPGAKGEPGVGLSEGEAVQQLREALKILAERVLILEHMIGIHENTEGSGFGGIADPLSFSGLKTKRRQPVQTLPQAPELRDRQRRVPV
ncbi:unnamed protein product [Menidia menidia]|uniref:(Atlantic silverside) hypothetical protein n=1 Tax=Menidia menidia TaxID=238744 RepID=A0A8S4BR92_9TELE|nr:unnamed protein product [Menidia menidia]